MGKLDSLNLIQLECAKIGLEPLEIKKESQIKTLANYFKDIGIFLKEEEIIPIGYDYDCLKGACSGRFKSLNSENSKDSTIEFKNLLDQNNLMNMKFTKGFYSQRNSIGFALNQGKLQYFTLGTSIIKGIVCSNNIDDSDFNTPKFINANCFTHARGNEDFQGELFTNIKVKIISLVLKILIFGFLQENLKKFFLFFIKKLIN